MYFNCDDADMVAYVPVYCCGTEVPDAFDAGNNKNGVFSWDGAYWLCNFVSNFIYPRYSAMISDLRVAQKELEDYYAADQEIVLETVKDMTRGNMVTFLTEKTSAYTRMMMERWDRLYKDLIVKYNDQPGDYSQQFYDAIVRATGDRYLIPE